MQKQKIENNGVSTNSYGDNKITLDFTRVRTRSLFLKNTGDTNSIKVKVVDPDLGIEIIPESTILAESYIDRRFNSEQYDKLDVYIKSAASNSSSSWKLVSNS